MKDMQSQTGKIFSRCFSKEELDFLQVQPEFIEANRNVETIEDALDAVELGEELIRRRGEGLPMENRHSRRSQLRPFPPI